MADLEELIRRIAREEARTPEYVTQRNVETVVGLSRRAYLRASLAGRWPNTREQRLVVARTRDVLQYVEQRLALRAAVPANDRDAEAVAFARSGARRVSR
jgi:hypothetical protein